MATPNELLNVYATQSEMSTFYIDKMGIVNVKSYGAVGNGTTDDYTAIYNASATADDNGGIIFFPVGTYHIGTSITFPANVTLWFADGAKLKPANGKVITGTRTNIQAGLYQIFDLSASGSTGAAGTWDIKEAFIEWFGATGSNATNDTAGLKYAIAFVNAMGGGRVLISNNTFYINEEIVVPYKVSISGVSKNSSILNFNNATNGLKLSTYADMSQTVIEKLLLIGTGSAAGKIGILLDDTHMVSLRDIYLSGWGTGIKGNKAILSDVTNYFVTNCDIGIEFYNQSYVVTLGTGMVRSCRVGGYFHTNVRMLLNSTDWEACTETGIVSAGAVECNHLHIEDTVIGVLHSSDWLIINDAKFADLDCGVKNTENNCHVLLNNMKMTEVTSHVSLVTASYQINNILTYALDGSGVALSTTLPANIGIMTNAFARTGKPYLDNYEKGMPGYNGKEVVINKTYAMVNTVNFGSVAANSTTDVEITVTAGVTVDYYTEFPVLSFTDGYEPPAGVIFTTFIKNASTTKIYIRCCNVTAGAITVNSVPTVLSIFNRDHA